MYLGPSESDLNCVYWRSVDVSQFTQGLDLCLTPSMVTYHHERPKAPFIVSGRANKFQNSNQQQAASSTSSKELPKITEFNGSLITTDNSVQTPVNTVTVTQQNSAPQMNQVSGNLNAMSSGNMMGGGNKRGKLVFDDGEDKKEMKKKKILKFED